MKRKIVGMLLVGCLFMVGCGGGGNAPKDDSPKELDKQAVEQKPDDGTVILGTGNFYVGEDIPAGRYVITSNELGTICIYGEGEKVADLSEAVDPTGEDGSKSVTYELLDKQKIEIGNIDEAYFTPKE